MTDADEEVDRRYPARELDVGWGFRSPLGRWETVTRVANDPYWVRVWTEQVGPGWSWRFWEDEKLHAIPPQPEQFVRQPEIRIVDLGRKWSPRITAVLTFADVEIPNFGRTTVLVEAARLGKGPDWEVSTRPDGGDLVQTRHPSKAQAKTAVRQAARAHGKVLGVPVCEAEGWHHHDEQ